jgi:HD-GYP domain-containing protein (c-di-GMP phosphodiesterase class II)
MSIPARILAIADIFEALTATDRPYKQPKKLSQALRIMSLMRDDQHIDADLFDLFLKSGVYLHYAKKYMDPRLIDTVEVEKYLTVYGDLVMEEKSHLLPKKNPRTTSKK